MTRPFVVLLVVFNAAVVVVAMIAFVLVHRDHRAIDIQEVERRVSARLASATTPADTQSNSAAIGKMTAGAVRAVESSVTVVDHTFEFLFFVGAFNIIFVLLGVRHAKKVLRHNPSNQSLEPTAGRLQ
jgi:hypothetical protein